jgi:hypothetical protein
VLVCLKQTIVEMCQLRLTEVFFCGEIRRPWLTFELLVFYLNKKKSKTFSSRRWTKFISSKFFDRKRTFSSLNAIEQSQPFISERLHGAEIFKYATTKSVWKCFSFSFFGIYFQSYLYWNMISTCFESMLKIFDLIYFVLKIFERWRFVFLFISEETIV